MCTDRAPPAADREPASSEREYLDYFACSPVNLKSRNGTQIGAVHYERDRHLGLREESWVRGSCFDDMLAIRQDIATGRSLRIGREGHVKPRESLRGGLGL